MSELLGWGLSPWQIFGMLFAIKSVTAGAIVAALSCS